VAAFADFPDMEKFGPLEDSVLFFERNRNHTGMLTDRPKGRPAWAKGLIRHQAWRRYQQPRDHWPSILNGKPFATLGAPTIDEGTTTFGRHALQETMGARTLDSAGLVSTFHG
jgi:hypothetical protein